MYVFNRRINGINCGKVKTKITHIMKKLLFAIAIAGFAFACNDGSKSAAASTDTIAAASTVAPAADSSATAAQPALKDGLMTLKAGKMLIVKAGAWVPLDSAVTCTNGRKVAVDGEVSKGGKKRKLEEGMMIDKDGQMMDKNGKAMDTSGWD
jgi:hypothetical protein